MNPLLGTMFLLGVLLQVPKPPVQIPAATFEGRPFFAENADLGYYLWKDGDTWRLRWTTRGAMRHFAGSVSAEGAKLKSFKRIDVEKERKVLFPGRAGHSAAVIAKDPDTIEKEGDSRIVFSIRTKDDIDGFDFKADKKVTELRFLLQIDGKQYPKLVQFGRGNQKASSIPLVVGLP